MQKITPNLWFDTEAEEAARFYTSIFKNSRIIGVTHYGEAGPRPAGSVLTVTFELDGMQFVALNGGPEFKFNEAISLAVSCETQDEIDELWEKLSADPESEQCGWLKDKYGLSWQIVPAGLSEMMEDPDPAKSNAVMEALLKMKKLDIAELKRAYEQAAAR